MWTPTKNHKCCATCANWSGARKAHGSLSEVASNSMRAKCLAGCSGSAMPGPCACEGSNCSKYQPWPAINK